MSEATDPDLLKFLQVAGGVLTQQGGVTAHAAIICREIGIPAIIGIEGLLDAVRDGDVVQVDAYNGTVTLLTDNTAPAPGLLVAADQIANASIVGSKAVNLGRLQSLGFNVPRFVVLRYELVEHYLTAENDTNRKTFTASVRSALQATSRSTLAIRSSAVDEDTELRSLAGEFESILDVPLPSLWRGLKDFCRRNAAGKSGQVYRGAVIVQLMERGDIGGVCLTSRDSALDMAVCEMSVHGADDVTAGCHTPSRITFNKHSGDVAENAVDSAMQPIVTQIFPKLLQTCQQLERRFGDGLDFEWTYVAGTFYVLQVRPIVMRPIVR